MGEKIGISAAREVEAHSRERTSTTRARQRDASSTSKGKPPAFLLRRMSAGPALLRHVYACMHV